MVASELCLGGSFCIPLLRQAALYLGPPLGHSAQAPLPSSLSLHVPSFLSISCH